MEPLRQVHDTAWGQVLAGIEESLVPVADDKGYTTCGVLVDGEPLAGRFSADRPGSWTRQLPVDVPEVAGTWQLRVTGPPEVEVAHESLLASATTWIAAMYRVWQTGAESRELLAEAAHDMRAPLSVLRTLTGSPFDVDAAATREVRNETVAHLSALVEGMVTTYQTAQRPALTSARVEAGELLGQVRDAVGPLAGAGVRCRTVGAATVDTDEVVLRRLVENLAVNAARATEQGVILLAASDTSTGAWFSVCDTGPGLPAAVENAITRPAEQLEPGSDPTRMGLGLGWLVVRKLADRLHATIQADVGSRGTDIHVHVPSLRTISNRQHGPQTGRRVTPAVQG